MTAASTLVAGVSALKAYVHDDTFTPDVVFRVSRETISVAGIERYSTLVNGSMPAPELRIPEHKVVWIRVHNDVEDANATIVSCLAVFS